MAKRTASFDEFWLYYLRVHARRRTRQIHYVAISVGILGILVGLFVDDYGLIAIGSVIAGYLIAWSAHATVQHNHPAFFKAPVWSLAAGLRMYYEGLTGGLDEHLRRAGILDDEGTMTDAALRELKRYESAGAVQ